MMTYLQQVIMEKFQILGKHQNFRVNTMVDSYLLCSIAGSPFGQIADAMMDELGCQAYPG